MPSTNKTEALKLTQYIDSDIVSFLQDYNVDMQKIDAFVKRRDNPHAVTAAQVGASNPNLLINGDFQIQQRTWRENNYYESGWAYFIDRWYCGIGEGCYLKKQDDGLHWWGGTNDNIGQICEIKPGENKTYTLSFLAWGNGSIVARIIDSMSITSSIAKGSREINLTDIPTIYTLTVTGSWSNYLSVQLSSSTASEKVIKWIKIEVGSVATPFISRLCGEELALCQRYTINLKNNTTNYDLYGLGVVLSNGSLRAYIPLPNAMRIKPTVSFNELKIFNHNTFSYISGVSNVSVAVFQPNGIIIDAVPDTALTVGAVYAFGGFAINGAGKLFIDAEIY